MLNIFSKESARANKNFIVVTTSKTKVIEYGSSFHAIMIRDLCSLKNFGFGVRTEMKGGYKI
ncbi:MAG: hypothetical protein ABIH59_02535 [archaeon]